MKRLRLAGCGAARPPRARQRGVVLFIALIVMVALTLAAIALIRSVDTTNAVVGNLAFRLASILPANGSVEQAAAALFSDVDIANVVRIPDLTVDNTGENYYATKQAGESNGSVPPGLPAGIPVQLQKLSNFTLPKKFVDPSTGTVVAYVIERMCIGPTLVAQDYIKNCDLVPLKVNPADTVGDPSFKLPGIPFYRVTVRVDGPQRTSSFVQAMLR